VNVVIVGQAPRSMDPPVSEHETWVINGPHFPDRWDRLFQLHGVEHIRRRHGKKFLERLGAISPPRRLIMTGREDDPANAEAYPLQKILTGARRRYLTNSFALALALAIDEGAEFIWLDGLMVPQGAGQWDAQESWIGPCIEYWVGRAEALGRTVVTPPGCGLFRSAEFVYGFEGPGSV
jgi:hypothetical protein